MSKFIWFAIIVGLGVGYTTYLMSANTLKPLARSNTPMKQVMDMRGRSVAVPVDPQRVVTLDDGFVGGVMTVLGQADKIVGLGSHCAVKNFSYTYPSQDDTEYSYVNGMNPVGYLNPHLQTLPILATYGQATNFETLARLQPDVVFLRVGSCYADDNTGDSAVLQRKIEIIESLGLPLVVLYAPSTMTQPTVDYLTQEILLVGEVFNQSEKVSELVDYLHEPLAMIAQRTQNIAKQQRTRVLMLGLSPKARGQGGAGTAFGHNTLESYFLQNWVHAENVFTGSGSSTIVNAEHLLQLDPDVIILPTSWGYHPPSELYTAPYYRQLQHLKAVKNRRVVALPWTPCNCAKRIEYPIDILIMAKASYPELFQDIVMHQWVVNFYERIYGVDTATARELRSRQWLDWLVTEQW